MLETLVNSVLALINVTVNKIIKFDERLTCPLEFVCKIIGVTKEKFVTLALANLLSEEMDEIEHNNNFDANLDIMTKHKDTVKIVKN